MPLPAATTISRRSPRWAAWAPAWIILAGVAAYANSLGGAFVFDDLPSIVDNPAIGRFWPRAGGGPESTLTAGGRPVAFLSFALNHAISGNQVWSYHAANLLIHILAGLALLGILRRTRGAEPIALAVALIWTAHPLQTEAVAYIVQRTESLAGLFYLLTLYCFVRSAENETLARSATQSSTPPLGSGSRKAFVDRRWAAASVLCCLLGMATKETVATAPLAILLYDRTFLAGSFGEAWRRRRPYYAALAATWIPLALLVAGTGGTRGGTAGLGVGVTPLGYGLTQLAAIAHYLRLAFWPHPLVFDYGISLVENIRAVILPGILVLVLVAGTLTALRRRSWLGFAGAWFFLTLAPSSSFIPIATQTMAEHRMYLALAAVAVVAVAGLRVLLRRWMPAACAALACCLVLLTAQRNRAYATSLTLWQKTAEVQPANERARNNYGVALLRSGRTPAAIEQFRAALRLDPYYAEPRDHLGVALSQYGHELLQAGRGSEAVAPLREAVRLKPEMAEAHNNLGSALEGAPGDSAAAIAEYREAIRLRPTYAEAHSNLGIALARSGNLAESIPRFEDALRQDPSRVDARIGLGIALAQTGRIEEAARLFAEALRIDPTSEAARQNLALAQQYLRNFHPENGSAPPP